MKKKLFALTAIASAILAVSAGGLIACSKSGAPSKPSGGTGGTGGTGGSTGGSTGGNTNTTTTYTITLDANGGTAGATTTATTGTDGKLATLPAAPTAPDDSKIFIEWATAATGGTTVDTSYVFTSNSTIYAQWDTGYTITLDPNGGKLTTTTVKTGKDGKLATLPAAPTAPEGKTFSGWYTAKTSGTEITTSTVFNKNDKIYAVWEDAGEKEIELTGDSAIVKFNNATIVLAIEGIPSWADVAGHPTIKYIYCWVPGGETFTAPWIDGLWVLDGESTYEANADLEDVIIQVGFTQYTTPNEGSPYYAGKKCEDISGSDLEDGKMYTIKTLANSDGTMIWKPDVDGVFIGDMDEDDITYKS